MIDVLRLRRLSLASAQQWASSLAAACAFCAVAAGGELALPIAIAFPLALGFSVAFGDRVAGKYQWAWTAALVLAVVIELVLVVLGREDPVLAAAQFSVLLCVLQHRVVLRTEPCIHVIRLSNPIHIGQVVLALKRTFVMKSFRLGSRKLRPAPPPNHERAPPAETFEE